MGAEKPIHPSVEDLPIKYREVLSLIGTGLENPTTVDSIAKLTNMSTTAVRATVTDLIVTYNFPIGGSNIPGKYGYYMINNREELNVAVKNLKSRAFKILKRAQALEKMPDPEQIDLDL